MFLTTNLVLVITCTIIFTVLPTKADELKTYIVQLSLPEGEDFSHAHQIDEWYNSFLSKVGSGSNEKPEMVYTYHHAITGFAAKMSADQAKAMEGLTGVLSVRPERMYQLLTTRSPHFLGLSQNSGLWKDSNKGKGIIIGVIDTGITPGHPSFKDDGVPPPPSGWKGKCEVAGCNNKLIGMRNFVPETSSPVDHHGHGTHTSSTAAGSSVDNANVFGMANGTASGIAPLAHVANYKVCTDFCRVSAVIAGMDAAIEDGVNVMSISIGGGPEEFYRDSMATAAYSAMKKGIVVSLAAGNSGPESNTVENAAPWQLTVGASSIDRRIRTSVVLGNKKVFDGESLYQPKGFDHKFRPLVYPGKDGNLYASFCLNGSLDHIDVKGKVVVCDVGIGGGPPIEKGQVVKDAGGAAVILANEIVFGETVFAEAHVLPASYVGYKEGVEIKKYLNSTSSPVATILFRGTILGTKSDPQVTWFSSRGPNSASPGILKPDVVAPGLNILAAWNESIDHRLTKAAFNMISGTSMSCPHLSGISALLKNAHPEWSPAAIKSAIMTTAGQLSRDGHPIVDEREHPADVFAIGSGHVNPATADDPGLVFDIQPDDYIPYLCGLGYTPKQVEMIVKEKVNCSKTISEAQLNYPSFSVSLKSGESKTYSRTVTNVGPPDSIYIIRDISVPRGVHVEIARHPQQLSFTSVQEKATYDVTFTRDVKEKVEGSYGQGHMTWVYDKYTVRTPFAFKFE